MKFTPVRLAQSQLSQMPVSDGQLIFAYDTGNVYVDTALGRFQQGISMLSDSSQVPLAPADKLYFNKNKKQLLYNGISIGGSSMQKVVVQENTTAQAGKWYLCLSNATITLPQQHQNKDSIKVSTIQEANTVTIRPQEGDTIQSDSGFLLDVNNSSVQLVWDGAKWVVAQVVTPGQAVGFAVVNALPQQGDEKLYYNKEDNKLYFYADGQWQTNSYVPEYNVKLGKCTDLGIMFQSDSIQLLWKDPADVELNTAVLAQWNQTRLLKRKGCYPVSATDPEAEIVAVTSRELNNRDSKFNNPVYQDKSQSVYYKLFSQTVGGSWNNLDANCYPMTTDLSWGVVQSIVRAGKGPEFFPVGMVFQVQHTQFVNNGHSLFFRVVGYDQIEAQDQQLQHTMCLDMVHALLAAPYDGIQTIYALTKDTTAQQGKTYYKYSDSEYTALVEGSDYTVGSDVPLDTWYQKNDDNRGLGSNNFATSNILQWANSSDSAGRWFTKQTIWDNSATAYSGRNGFLRYLQPEFLNVVAAAKTTTAKCSFDGGGDQTIYTRFFPLSVTQVFGEQNNNISQDTQLSYYADTNNSKIKPWLSSGQASNWWTRSPYVAYAHTAHYVNPNGIQAWGICASDFGVSIACIIA